MTFERVSGILVALAGLAALASGCGGGGTDGGSGGGAVVVVDTVAGTERLTYGEEPVKSLPWTTDTVAVIGAAMGAAEYQFSAVGDAELAGAADGGVIVVDRSGARVLEYGPDGTHRNTYGRRGGGPGELSFATGAVVGPGDTIWVTDLMNRRVTGYPRAGGEPRSVPYPSGDAFPSSRLAVWDGGFLQVLDAVGPPSEAGPKPLLRLDTHLRTLDTLWVPPVDPMDIVPIDLGAREIVIGMEREFWPGLEWRALSDGSVVVSDSADYVFRLVASDGVVRRVIRRSPPARATTDADRQAVRDRVLNDADGGFSVTIDGGAPDAATRRRMAEERVAHMTFADRIPRIVSLEVDRQDRIWVGVAEDSAATVQRIDVYDRDGTLLGELRDFPFPAAFTGQDRILTTRRDELDVPQVVVIRVTERPAG